MKPHLIFYIGLSVDALFLLISLSNLLMVQSPAQESADPTLPDGLTAIGRAALWIVPLLLAGLIGLAFWLKNSGKLLAANIVLWIPALPLLLVFLLWAGMAVLFFVANIFK